MSTATHKADDLRIRSEITDALLAETRLIDEEIRQLRQARRDLKKLTRKAESLGKRAYDLMNIKGDAAATKYDLARREKNTILHCVLGVRGACDLYGELSKRHVDLWVKRVEQSEY